ncbi:replication endonuclease [Pseudomonas guariconensis]|uniref:replication endonuclease n=1 Tax=Pseudomonas guariconensis TaxID=1288410 RepID=UPI0039E8C132
MRQGFRYLPPSLSSLALLGNDELCDVARKIAASHYARQKNISDDEREEYCLGRHEYGVGIKKTSHTRSDGMMMRLRSEAFWRRQINLLADEHREHLAMKRRQLGAAIEGLMPYCSDQTLALIENRRACIQLRMKRGTDGCTALTKAEIFANSERSRFNQLFITVKAMEKLAQARDFQWALITLTCPPRFHPRSSAYEGLSTRAGHDYLSSQFRKLTKHLDKKYKANRDYFGVRVVEVHQDGCPHWHILLFGSATTLAFCRDKLERLHVGDGRPNGYFQEHHTEIFKEQVEQGQWASPISYVLKYLYPRRIKRAMPAPDTAKRVRCALQAAGIPQYKLIGADGIATKTRILKQVAITPATPPTLRKIAQTLNAPSAEKGERLQAMVELLDRSASEIQIVRTKCLNRYRESTTKITHVKHKNDRNPYRLAKGNLSPRLWGAVTIKESRIIQGSPNYAPAPEITSMRHHYKANDTHLTSYTVAAFEYPQARLRWKPP